MYTQDSLIKNLADAGIDPRGTLLCHFSMKQIGQVEGGADTVLDALCHYMRDGLLVIPTHTWANVDPEHPVYDVRETPANIGLLPNLFRQRPGVVRSLHPTHSLAALGAGAEEFSAGQERFDTPCAPGSSYGMLEKRDAQVLLVGVDFGRNTSIHCIEEVADVRNRLTDEHQQLYSRGLDGNLISVPSRRHSTGANSELFVKLQPVMAHRGVLQTVPFGAAACLSFRDKDLFRVTLELLERDIHLFDDDKPVPPEWF